MRPKMTRGNRLKRHRASHNDVARAHSNDAHNTKETGVVMKIETILNKNKGVIAVAALAIVVLAPLAYYAMSDVLVPGAQPFLEKPDPQYTECVRDTLYMRFHHMDLLKDIRVRVVREGERNIEYEGEEITLEGCMKCHTNRSRFCNQCHTVVNLHLDCFGCHNYPETPQGTHLARASSSGGGIIAGMIQPSH
jgi:hypothetical protein